MKQTVVEAIFGELKKKIAHRTSEKFAVYILTRFLHDLSETYEFLQYITINQTMYTEKNDVIIDPMISSTDTYQFSTALETLIQKIVIEMKAGADFFFIKEIQDALDDIDQIHHFINSFTPLESMQQEFLSQRIVSTAIPKTQLLIDIIHAVLATVNKYHSENETLSIVHSCIIEMEGEFSFFKEIILAGSSEKKGYYTLEMKSSIQQVPVYQLSKAFNRFFALIARHSRIEEGALFRDQLKQSLGQDNISLLYSINVSVDSIEFSSQSINEKKMFERLIISLLKIITQHTSDRFALMVMKKIIDEMKQQQKIVTTFQIELKDGGYHIIFHNDEAVSDTDKVRKAMKTLIERVGTQLKHKQSTFIQQLKEYLGKEYVTAIEDLGVNFHIFELKFI